MTNKLPEEAAFAPQGAPSGSDQPAPVEVTQFQARVEPWFRECFPAAVCDDRLERGDRLLEEVFELLQSGDYPAERVAALRDYTWGRAKGEPAQEVGGVMVTLAAYCIAHNLDMHEAGEAELARISQPAIVEKIRAKQAAKPVGSALPIATRLATLDLIEQHMMDEDVIEAVQYVGPIGCCSISREAAVCLIEAMLDAVRKKMEAGDER